MKHIVLDTNVLMAIAQFKIDVFTELHNICNFKYDVSVIDETLNELKKIKKEQRGKHSAAANLALQVIKKKRVKTIKTSGKYADDALAALSIKGYLIATQDKALKRKLKKPCITIRKKKYLVMV